MRFTRNTNWWKLFRCLSLCPIAFFHEFPFLFRSVKMASICHMPHAVHTFVQYFASVNTRIMQNHFFSSTIFSFRQLHCVYIIASWPAFTHQNILSIMTTVLHRSGFTCRNSYYILDYYSTCCSATFSSQAISYLSYPLPNIMGIASLTSRENMCVCVCVCTDLRIFDPYSFDRHQPVSVSIVTIIWLPSFREFQLNRWNIDHLQHAIHLF